MTAINVIIKRRSAHIISDGAQYLPTGEMLCSGSKVMPLPQMNAAIAARGPAMALPIFAGMLAGEFTTFDAMCNGVERSFAGLYDRFAAIMELTGAPDVQLTLVGFSESRDAYAAFIISSSSGVMAGGDDEAGRLIELPSVALAPLVDLDTLRAAGFKANGPDQMDVVRDGRRILEAQRALQLPYADGLPPIHCVGCFAQVTSITKDGITQRVFHRWPDEIGLPILPEAGEAERPELKMERV